MRPSLPAFAACLAIGVSGAALAWSGTAQAGAYRVTATMAPSSRSLSLTVASDAARPAAVDAWFVDSEGMILGKAAVPARTGGALVAYTAAVAVPDRAAAVVVMTRPRPVRSAAGGNPDVQVTQIGLPAR